MGDSCRFCDGNLVKAGKQKDGTQRYRCKYCEKYQQLEYKSPALSVDTECLVNIYLEGCGIRSLSRIFGISPGTVLNKIKMAAKSIQNPLKFKPLSSYEMDEMYTFIGNKSDETWISYAIERESKQVVDFVVGSRSKVNLNQIVQKVLSMDPKRVYTDRLNIYPGIIPKALHRPTRFMTNTIERLNLTLRTHLKRLSRRTICFSKSKELLEASLRLYFWSRGIMSLRCL